MYTIDSIQKATGFRIELYHSRGAKQLCTVALRSRGPVICLLTNWDKDGEISDESRFHTKVRPSSRILPTQLAIKPTSFRDDIKPTLENLRCYVSSLRATPFCPHVVAVNHGFPFNLADAASVPRESVTPSSIAEAVPQEFQFIHVDIHFSADTLTPE